MDNLDKPIKMLENGALSIVPFGKIRYRDYSAEVDKI